jgi:hypothetical protein
MIDPLRVLGQHRNHSLAFRDPLHHRVAVYPEAHPGGSLKLLDSEFKLIDHLLSFHTLLRVH